jgi:predicted glycosyltransferase
MILTLHSQKLLLVAGDLNHPTVMNHMLRVQDYLWVAEDGMSMQGYNGSQCWVSNSTEFGTIPAQTFFVVLT